MKTCAHCGKAMERKRYGTRLEDAGVFKRRKFCGLTCANTRNRPKHWETHHYHARKHKQPTCAGCGTRKNLHVHHVDGNPQNNRLENLQTLCVHCHNFTHATAERLGWPQPGAFPVGLKSNPTLAGLQWA